MPDRFEFIEPRRKQSLVFTVLPVDRLDVVTHQRKPSKPHVKHVSESIDRVGFLVPLVAVEQAKDGDTRYIIIDGQHRFLAAKDLGITELPVVVVPPELAPRMMNLNVEKDPNIREKSSVAISIYREFADSRPDMKESDPELRDSIEQIHYVTLGLAYEKAARLAGSSFEPILKRCDEFLDEPLKEALDVRKARAEKLLEANDLVRSVTEKVKEQGAENPYLSQQIMSYANPFKGKRGAGSFDEAFEKVIERLRQLEGEPERLLRG